MPWSQISLRTPSCKWTDLIHLGWIHQTVCNCEDQEWKTPPFEIKWGMFQGNTLSPVIFLNVFNPLVELSNNIQTCGFSLKVLVPNSVVLPPVNSAIYVHWDESSSNEPTGWYYAVVKVHLPNGTTTIEYMLTRLQKHFISMVTNGNLWGRTKSVFPQPSKPTSFSTERSQRWDL